MTKKLLDRAAIDAAQDIETEDVHVPEWGGYVRVKALSAAERAQYQASIVRAKLGEDGRIERELRIEDADIVLAALGIVDEAGRHLYGVDEAREKLGAHHMRALNRVVAVIKRLSALRDEDVDSAVVDLEHGARNDSISSSRAN